MFTKIILFVISFFSLTNLIAMESASIPENSPAYYLEQGRRCLQSKNHREVARGRAFLKQAAEQCTDELIQGWANLELAKTCRESGLNALAKYVSYLENTYPVVLNNDDIKLMTSFAWECIALAKLDMRSESKVLWVKFLERATAIALRSDNADLMNALRDFIGNEGYRAVSKDRKVLYEDSKVDAGGEMVPLRIVLDAFSGRKAECREQIDGWFVTNSTKSKLYCALYRKYWHVASKTWCLFQIPHQEIGELLTKKKFIPLSRLNSIPWFAKAHDFKLIFALAKELLKEKILMDEDGELPQGMIACMQDDLGTLNGTIEIVEDEEGLKVEASSREIRVNNTTDVTYYCALYYADARGGVEKISAEDVVACIPPQLSCSLQLPQLSLMGVLSRKSLTLLVAREDAQKLLRKNLSKDELESFKQQKLVLEKSFNNTNRYEWYKRGIFDIVIDCDGAVAVKSHGDGFLLSVGKSFYDISSISYAEQKEYERKFHEKDPLYVVPQANFEGTKVLTRFDHLKLEKQYIQARQQIVRAAINELLNEPDFALREDEVPPSIALVFSGGGYRAMIETLGFLKGAAHKQSGNVLDCCNYMTGLSGSTWAINSFVASGLESPQAFCEKQKSRVVKSKLQILNSLINDSTQYRVRRFIQSRYGQEHGLVGIWGHMLGHALLHKFGEEDQLGSDNPHHLTLSDLQKKLNPKIYPLPISVAVSPGMEHSLRTWYEFSPFYVGTFQHGGGWIETCNFGSLFSEGKLIRKLHEYRLVHNYGIWGSAFALSAEDMAKVSKIGGYAVYGLTGIGAGASKGYNAVFGKASHKPARDDNAGRITCEEIPNFFYKMKDKQIGELSDIPKTTLIDGGIVQQGEYRHNFASVPALSRNADILIMCDSNDSPDEDEKTSHLAATDEEAKRLGLPFPNFAYGYDGRERMKDAREQVATCIEQDGKPIVVYMKAKENKEYNKKLKATDSAYLKDNGFNPDANAQYRNEANFTATTNFTYTPEQFDVLSGLTQEIFIQSKEQIKKALRIAIARNRNRK